MDVKMVHRFYAATIDSILIIAIIVLLKKYLFIPIPNANWSNLARGMWLIVDGVYLIVSGGLKILTIPSPVIFVITKVTKIIMHSPTANVVCQYLVYYFIFERLLKASPGKFVFGIKVIGIDSKGVTTLRILIRTLSRLLPLEAFSFLPARIDFWHDRLSKTKVAYK